MGWLEVSLRILEVSMQALGLIYQHLGYIRDLSGNVTTLMKETVKLKRKRDEVEGEVKVKDAESVGKKRRRNVGDWLQDVGEIVAEVDSIRSEFDRGKTNPLSQHKLGKRVAEKIQVVKTLQDKGILDEVAKSPPCPQMQKMQVPRELEQQSTSQETLQEIEEALSDEEIGIVSVCGMGGIGKTTLMQKIYNRLLETRNFDVVLWVTLSKDLNLNVIQQKIGNKLEVQFGENDGIEERRDKLNARLMNVRYMLILDDLWQKFSLDHIRIPQPNKENRCKIAITTRSVEVGRGMEADSIIRVKTLSRVEAWELFCSKTGDVVLQPEIQTLALKVVRECGGLPLAIKTVGGAMRQKSQKELWQNALRALRAPAAAEVPGMEREVFLPLKLSYDCLEDREIQSCFLYCSLYPQDYSIDTADLVTFWACEAGLINKISSMDEALNKGHYILARLTDACLLDEADEVDEDEDDDCLYPHVRMHDLLRDLALWIGGSKFLVKAGERLEKPPEEKLWGGMQRISLMRNHIKELQMTPNCPDLVSLSLYDNFLLHTIHNSFFQLMPKLQILDLRKTGIESLPPSLSQLVNLRVLDASQCRNLQDVPPLGHLKELQLLDLGGTGIESLPQGIASPAKLKSLDLSETKALATIPLGIISRLASLEDLGLCGHKQMMSMEIWREVATLPRLTSLRIILPSLDAFSANDMKHPMWSRLSRFQVQFGHRGTSFRSNSRERTLLISDCEELPSLQKAFDGGPPKGFQQLKSIFISGCHKLRCIFSSSMLPHLHPLESLTVSNCEEIVEIVDGGPLPDMALQRLRDLNLFELPKLERISVFACQMCISDCPKLRFIFSSSLLQHLHSLERLSVYDCEEIVDIVEGGPLPNMALQILNLVGLPKLERISVFACQMCISDCPKLKFIFSSSMLQHPQSLERLSVYDCEEIVEIVEGGPLLDTVLQRLKYLRLERLPELKSISTSVCHELRLPKLKGISISGCRKLRCIFSSGVLQHLHPLESLTVKNCEEIVEIVEGGPLPDSALQRLRYLSLKKLPKLMAICSWQLVLTSMEKIRIKDCPGLKMLPILCSGIKQIRGYISASREWWEGIGWEDGHSKSLYSTIYIERKETLQGDEMMMKLQSLSQQKKQRELQKASHRNKFL